MKNKIKHLKDFLCIFLSIQSFELLKHEPIEPQKQICMIIARPKNIPFEIFEKL